MSFEFSGADTLDYRPCRYGKSRLLFRGPRKRLDQPYIAVVGGTEVFGRYSDRTLSDCLEELTGKVCVNLGCQNAGIDAFVNDASVIELCRNAMVTVVQVMGAHNMSNRFYSVHPRRNDRFLDASVTLKSLAGELDFTQVHYTRHLLAVLKARGGSIYEPVRAELEQAWKSRMIQFADAIGGPLCLLWLADRAPDDNGCTDPFGHDPLFVNEPMLRSVSEKLTCRVTIVATRDEVHAGRERLHSGQLRMHLSEHVLGPVVYERAATAIARTIARHLK